MTLDVSWLSVTRHPSDARRPGKCSLAVAAVIVLACASALICRPCIADIRSDPVVTHFENSPNGPILTVRLYSRKAEAPDLDLRFMLDTGAGVNVLDVSVPPDYFWEPSGGPEAALTDVVDAADKQFQASIAYLKRMEVGGISRDDQPAIRLDLKKGWPGAGQDDPIDGVLGMSFLRGTSFVIDPMRQEIRWWQTIDGHRVPLAYDPSGSPAMLGRVSNTDIWFTLDTGSPWGFQAPGHAEDRAASEGTFLISASGHVSRASIVNADRIEVGGKAWINEPLVMVTPGEGSPMVGRKILLAGLLGLDFGRNAATFQLDSTGNLLSLPLTAAPRSGLSLAWDRNDDQPRLTVGPLGPNSPMEVAGFKPGDVLVRVGPLRGDSLKIEAVTTLVERGQAMPWLVSREGELLRLRFPVDAPAP